MIKINKFTIALILTIVLVVILIILWLWLGNKKPKISEVNNNVNTNVPSDSFLRTGIDLGSDSPEIGKLISKDDQKPENAAIVSLAKVFAERFGSYSTDTENFENLRELASISTEKMIGKLNGMMKNSGIDKTGEYYGVSTRAISTKIISLDENMGSATISINCQRRERRESEESLKYQDLDLMFKKTGEVWKVDNAVWK